MTPASPAARYWNARLDPMDWHRARPHTDRGRWKLAFETFLSPDTRDAIQWLGDLRGRRVLELGSGHGYGSLHLARSGAHVVGLDLSERRCAAARRETARVPSAGSAGFCAGQALHLPFADESFDAIFSRDVLMYAPPNGVARECHRVLAPGAPVAFVESLAGNPLMGAFRRLNSSEDYRNLTRHLHWDEMARLGEGLECERAQPYYLLSLAAFFALFSLGSVAGYRVLLKLFFNLDRVMLERLPLFAPLAWRGTALYRKPDHVR